MNAVIKRCFLINMYVSIPNAEKVVKPPRTPIIINSYDDISFIKIVLLTLINNPIIKQPIRLIISVPIGKLVSNILLKPK